MPSGGQFGEALTEIIDLYKDGSDEPLDGDEVDTLTEHLRNAINLHEGNIVEAEYDELEKSVPKTIELIHLALTGLNAKKN